MHISDSYSLKNVTIKNRIVMPPMVCFGWSSDTGLATEAHIEHYENRAKGGAGLIILEAHAVTKEGRLSDTQLGIWDDDHISGLRAIGEACHRYGAKVLVQIHHAGLKTPQTVTSIGKAPSDHVENGKEAKTLSIDEIHNIQHDFVEAAKRAKEAGLDGIELHGAHGYLIDQFMSTVTNKRNDEYGGEFKSRMRFVLEIINNIKIICDENFILGYRLGANSPSLSDGIETAKALEQAGVELLHVSAGIPSGDLPMVPEGLPFNWIVYMGTEIQKHVSIPVIVVNGIRTRQDAEYIIDNQLAQFVAVGRGFLVDSSWASKVFSKEEVKPCLKCAKCQWFKNGKLCPQNK